MSRTFYAHCDVPRDENKDFDGPAATADGENIRLNHRKPTSNDAAKFGTTTVQG